MCKSEGVRCRLPLQCRAAGQTGGSRNRTGGSQAGRCADSIAICDPIWWRPPRESWIAASVRKLRLLTLRHRFRTDYRSLKLEIAVMRCLAVLLVLSMGVKLTAEIGRAHV